MRGGIREFRDHATQYLARDEILAIERHGGLIGSYVPTATNPRETSPKRLSNCGRPSTRFAPNKLSD